MMVPVNEPVISKEAKKYALEALNTGWLSSAGPHVKKFEEAFARYLGVKHAISVTSGTAALHVALLALGIGKGDEVVVPAFTMAATWMAVLYTGAKPVFVDCEMDSFNIEVKQITAKITKRTRAIIPVHIYGHACDMDKITILARRHRLWVIEDSAEALGGMYKKKMIGNMGDIGCFSFYANKLVTSGEGGMLVTDDDDIAQKARRFKDLCHSPHKRFIHDGLGFNYRMTNLQAAVGLGELRNIKKYLKLKQWMAKVYTKRLNGIPGITLPRTKPYVLNTYWMYGIVVDKKLFGLSRDQLRNKLKKSGIDTRDFFYAPEDQPVLKKIIRNQKFPNSKYLSEHGLYLPSGLAIKQRQIQRVCKNIRDIYYERFGMPK